MTLSFVLSFIGGAMGSMFGSMAMVITYAVCALAAPVVQNEFFSQYIVGVMLIPAVAFAGGIPAIAFAANTRKHPVSGLDIFLPQWFGVDDWVQHLIGGSFGVFGYGVVVLCGKYGFPGDAGALSIVIANLVVRKLCYRQKLLTCDPSQMKEIGRHLWAKRNGQLITPIFWGCFVGMVVFYTGNPGLMFSVSAASLVMKFFEPRWPITHHMSVAASLMAAAFAMDNVVLAAVLGAAGAVLASAVFEIANVWIGHGEFWRDHRKVDHAAVTYIDPPSCAVLVSSLLIALISALVK